MSKFFWDRKLWQTLRYFTNLQQQTKVLHDSSTEFKFLGMVVEDKCWLFLPVHLDCSPIHEVLTNEIEDGWYTFTKAVPSTTAVRGPAARKNRKLFLVFPCKQRPHKENSQGTKPRCYTWSKANWSYTKCFMVRMMANIIEPMTKGGHKN